MNSAHKFTLADDKRLEKLLADAMSGIAADIAALPCAGFIDGVILGGGYGRGEGGAFIKQEDGSAHLYNDLDFFVFSKTGSEHAGTIDAELAKIAEKWAETLEIDVDFAPARPPDSLKKVASTLMFMELRAGFCPVFGKTDALEALPMPDFSKTPFSEADRLLMNRGAGLLFASGEFQKAVSCDRTDFIARNINKAILGLGDSALVYKGAYVKGVHTRLEALKALPDAQRLAAEYEKAVSFKTFPRRPSETELRESFDSALSLWLETMNVNFTRPGAASVVDALAALPVRDGVFWKNAAHNMISRMRFGFHPVNFFAHPRVTLLADLYQYLAGLKGLPTANRKASNARETWLGVWRRYN